MKDRYQVKFLIDMALSPKVVKFLNARGFKAIRVNDLMPGNSSDRAIFQYAQKHDNVIITADLDFGKFKPR